MFSFGEQVNKRKQVKNSTIQQNHELFLPWEYFFEIRKKLLMHVAVANSVEFADLMCE